MALMTLLYTFVANDFWQIPSLQTHFLHECDCVVPIAQAKATKSPIALCLFAPGPAMKVGCLT